MTEINREMMILVKLALVMKVDVGIWFSFIKRLRKVGRNANGRKQGDHIQKKNIQ